MFISFSCVLKLVHHHTIRLAYRNTLEQKAVVNDTM